MQEETSTLSPVWGIIFKIWDVEPVYHKLAPSRDRVWRPGLSARVTSCGRPVGLTTPMLPMMHCRTIGKPCKGCFQ